VLHEGNTCDKIRRDDIENGLGRFGIVMHAPEQEALVWLFRAVSRAGLDDIADFGGFRQSTDGLSYEGELFATSVEDAATFGRIHYRLDLSIGRDYPC
jgi:hypothetical protein